MSHQVRWNKRIFDTFVREAKLSPLEMEIMETRIAGMTRVQQSMYFSISLPTLDRYIANLKKRYDDVQPYNADILPVRRNSAYEKYLDEN